MLQTGDEDLVGYYFSGLYVNIRQDLAGKIGQKFVFQGGSMPVVEISILRDFHNMQAEV
jgi:hypothetical protein